MYKKKDTRKIADVMLAYGMLRLSRSLSRFETQDIKTQPLFNLTVKKKQQNKGERKEDKESWN